MIRTLTPIFSIVTALLVFYFVTQPKFLEIKQMQGEAAQYQSAASKAAELNAELSRMIDEKRAYPSEALEKLEALVPLSIDEVKILNDLNEVAKSNSMLFGNVSVTNSDVESRESDAGMAGEAGAEAQILTGEYAGLAATDINFSLIGTYEQFKAFLADIEQSLVMVEITQIDFTTGESFLQQYTLSARVFSLAPVELE